MSAAEAACPVPAGPRSRVRWLPLSAAAAALVFVVAQWFFRASGPPGPTPAYAELEEVQGEVLVQHGSDEPLLAQNGEPLRPGSEVCTAGEGSYAVVVYADGTRLELNTDSTLRLRQGSGKEVHLADGFVRAEVAAQPRGRPMILTTPHALVRVLGTRFTSAAVEVGTRIDLEEGKVVLTRTSDGKSIEVEQGRYAVATVEREPVPAFVSRTLPPRITNPRAIIPLDEGPVSVAAFSPRADLLAIGGAKGGVMLYGVDGQPRFLCQGHSRKVRVLAWAHDGSVLVTGGDDRAVKVWDPQTGLERREIPQRREVEALALSPDGYTLAVVAGSMKVPHRIVPICLFDLRSGASLGELAGHPAGFHALAFSPDGRLLASAGKDGKVRLWELTLGQDVGLESGHGDQVQALAFSTDGHWLASGSRDRTIRLWKPAAWAPEVVLEGHPREVKAVAFSPDGRWLASAGGEGAVRLWDRASGRQVLTFQGHKCCTTSVSFSRDGRTLATAGGDRTVKLWDLDPSGQGPDR